MLTTKVVADPIGPSRRVVLATLLIVVFSAGMIVGAVAARALEEPIARAMRPASPAVMVPSKGVGDNDVSKPAPPARIEAPWYRGVADRSESAAARAAFFEEWIQSLPHDTEGDAARAARLEDWFRSVVNAGATSEAGSAVRRGER